MKQWILTWIWWGCVISISAISHASVLVEMATNYGSFTIELNEKKAPKTVENFLTYVDSGFYDGTIFHRVIDNFMIQGGGFDKKMTKKETRPPIVNESYNRLSNVVGTIAMARTNDPNSATSQFYINVSNNTFLNYVNKQTPGYCVFGRVVKGMAVVQRIKDVPVKSMGSYQNVPITPVVIKRIRRVTEQGHSGSSPSFTQPVSLPTITD